MWGDDVCSLSLSLLSSSRILPVASHYPPWGISTRRGGARRGTGWRGAAAGVVPLLERSLVERHRRRPSTAFAAATAVPLMTATARRRCARACQRIYRQQC